MPKTLDLTGMKFGRLTVIEKTNRKNKNSEYYHKCLCECGNTKEITGTLLKRGKRLSCGCIRLERREARIKHEKPVNSRVDITGMKFGRLTVIEKTNRKNKSGEYYYKCACDCGNTKEAMGSVLKQGKLQSCGCINLERRQERNKARIKVAKPAAKRVDLTGQKFGMLTVVERTNRKNSSGEYYHKCLCECGNTKEVIGSRLKLQKVKSCGCLRKVGEGEIIGRKSGRLTIIERTDRRNTQGAAYYKAVCECGNTRDVLISQITQGSAKSCGCGNSEAFKARNDAMFAAKRAAYIDGDKKKCKRCSEWKPLDAFMVNRRSYMGRGPLCRECNNIVSGEWHHNNKDRHTAIEHNRNARKNNNGGKYTAAEWNELLERYDNTCLRCGRNDVPMTVDHVIPVSKGGTNSIDNIQPLCKSCNSSKNAKAVDFRPIYDAFKNQVQSTKIEVF